MEHLNAVKRRLIRNTFFMCASVVAAYFIVQLGTVNQFMMSIGGLAYAGSFIAGVFFTSAFTTIPAIAVLSELALITDPWIVALFGGVGAVTGDYILFLIVRQGLSHDVKYLIAHMGFKRVRKLFHTKLLEHVLPLLGALVLASPLPDELGLAMLGFSKIDKDRFLLISLAMNTFGIFVIAIIARSIAGV